MECFYKRICNEITAGLDKKRKPEIQMNVRILGCSIGAEWSDVAVCGRKPDKKRQGNNCRTLTGWRGVVPLAGAL